MPGGKVFLCLVGRYSCVWWEGILVPDNKLVLCLVGKYYVPGGKVFGRYSCTWYECIGVSGRKVWSFLI